MRLMLSFAIDDNDDYRKLLSDCVSCYPLHAILLAHEAIVIINLHTLLYGGFDGLEEC